MSQLLKHRYSLWITNLNTPLQAALWEWSASPLSVQELMGAHSIKKSLKSYFAEGDCRNFVCQLSDDSNLVFNFILTVQNKQDSITKSILHKCCWVVADTYHFSKWRELLSTFCRLHSVCVHKRSDIKKIRQQTWTLKNNCLSWVKTISR